jgi:hypothetical protein
LSRASCSGSAFGAVARRPGENEVGQTAGLVLKMLASLKRTSTEAFQ